MTSAWQRGIFIAFILVFMGAMAILAAPHLPRSRDFAQTFYPASRYTLAGENPYTAEYIETDQGAPPDFFSPAWLLLILLPFGLFPLEMAQALWVIFLIGVTIAGIGLMRPWGLKGLWPLALVALPWSLVGIYFGQVTALVFLGAIICIVEPEKPDRDRQSIAKLMGGFLLIGIKPQLGLFIAVPYLLLMLWRQDRRVIPLAIIGLIVLGITFIITPPWLVQKAIEVQRITAPLWKSTLERELLLWGWPSWIAHLVRVLVIGTMGYWAWRERALTLAWWSAWLAAVLIITPYTRAYDGVLLLPLLGQLLVLKRWWQTAVFLLVMLLYIQLPIGELGSVVAPLMAWLLFIPWRALFFNPPGGLSLETVPGMEPPGGR